MESMRFTFDQMLNKDRKSLDLEGVIFLVRMYLKLAQTFMVTYLRNNCEFSFMQSCFCSNFRKFYNIWKGKTTEANQDTVFLNKSQTTLNLPGIDISQRYQESEKHYANLNSPVFTVFFTGAMPDIFSTHSHFHVILLFLHTVSSIFTKWLQRSWYLKYILVPKEHMDYTGW